MKEEPSLTALRSRPHWSFSRINSLVNYCSLAWSFRYVRKLEPVSVPSALVFGSAFHDALTFSAVRRMQGRETAPGDCADVLAGRIEKECRNSALPVQFKSGETVDNLIEQGRLMTAVYLASLDPEEEVESVGLPFSVPLTDASGIPLDAPLIGEYDLVVRISEERTIVDWKSSASRWSPGKAESDLQPTCYLHAEHIGGRPGTRFRFDVITKTKTPACEQHLATRGPDDFRRLGELVRVLERRIANECFHPSDGSWECASCPYTSACRNWHREQARTFLHFGMVRAA